MNLEDRESAVGEGDNCTEYYIESVDKPGIINQDY
jgi:hypothetical protein